MDIYIGIDDTDNKESRGTGHLARAIAEKLSTQYPVSGILRHQLLFDPRVPYTAKNSCAAIILSPETLPDLQSILNQAEAMMQENFQPGSDPGLCVATEVPTAVIEFGRKAQIDLVHQSEARNLAEEHQILLCGLGGTQDGVIGALSAVGLAYSGQDGRYIEIGAIRALSGLQSVEKILQAGVHSIRTVDDAPVLEGMILADKMRPARRFGQPILYVQQEDGFWQPIKLD
jgi:tRNA(Ile2) C34 agmatinyltransferase TiaS